jgi:hypothetical protein
MRWPRVLETKPLRTIADPFLAAGPSGVAIRDRLRVSAADADVLREVGAWLGSLAGRDLVRRCRDGHDHSKDSWAARSRDLTVDSSSRWAGAITRSSHDQWVLSRRALARPIQNLQSGIAAVRRRLSLPLGQKGTRAEPGGYRSRQEWHTKSRRLAALVDRHAKAVADRQVGRVRVVRGGKRLARTRHHLERAQLTEQQWRQRWDAARMFLTAAGESGKRYGNETIRITPTVRSRSNFRHHWCIWPTPRTAGTWCRARSPSFIGATSGATGSTPIPRSLIRSAMTRSGTAGTSPLPGYARRRPSCRWPWRWHPAVSVWTPTTTTWPHGGWTRTATRSANPAASPTTSPAPPTIATPRSATPSPGCCTGADRLAFRRSRSRISTSPAAKPARSTAAMGGSGG